METKEINNYKKAGEVWKNVIKFARKKVVEEISLLELAEKIETKIIEEAGLAFPTNLSLNEEAAHFTPNGKKEDDRILKKEDLLKIDLGVQVEGYICDGAITINLNNEHAKQIEANELALENAITKAGFGKKIDDISKEIETTLKEKGFNPIYNLGGHGLAKNDIHSFPSIPNHASGTTAVLEEGAIAIEPFATTGKGIVSESPQVEIFSLKEGKNVRNIYGRKILEKAKKCSGLPFSERWLRKETKLNEFQFIIGLRELMKASVFETFPGLKEVKGAMVTQSEKSLLILEEKTIVLGE
ncbi:MAG: type II methionyl aminopeptidase [Candidatus ainarchaeum sp.]|nr:type II methionyl aminopeptidase [Candidatus ainarchaeum sp.]